MSERPYVSRGGLKLEAALDHFQLDVTGMTCADLGCSAGGFTDCLLQRGAARVFAVDTAYGQLDWKLRNDPRVTVMERSNALHLAPPDTTCDLVVIDLGWTKQQQAIPAALRWLTPPTGRVITLIKPHYEAGVHRLDDEEAQRVALQVIEHLPTLGVRVLNWVKSPLPGGKGGNAEWLALLEPTY
ncbi:MAG: TlyA family RNA methyltransferase [Phycisphaeraceae bacterium]|nr:TlyA family RNA methyltransferase [Phycisphaeraceae bacterium]